MPRKCEVQRLTDIMKRRAGMNEKTAAKLAEREVLADAATRHYEDQLEEMAASSRPLRKWLKTLDRMETEAEIIELGILDVDMVGYAEQIGLHREPEIIRYTATKELGALVRYVQAKALPDAYSEFLDALPFGPDAVAETDTEALRKFLKIR